LDRVDLARLHRRDPVPARAARDGRRVDGLAAPRREDDLGIPVDHRLRRDDPTVGPRLPAELDEDVTAAGDLDQLGDPADARDERYVPLLEVDARAVGPTPRILPDLVHLVPHLLNDPERGPRVPHAPAAE